MRARRGAGHLVDRADDGPADLSRRLAPRGFTEAEPEYGLVMAVADAGPPGHEVEPVTDEAGVDAFFG